jgi:hypothetical protein
MTPEGLGAGIALLSQEADVAEGPRELAAQNPAVYPIKKEGGRERDRGHPCYVARRFPLKKGKLTRGIGPNRIAITAPESSGKSPGRFPSIKRGRKAAVC